MHHVCDLCPDPAKLGATKLNKALWYIDTISYRLLGDSISGETAYVKHQHGPVPKTILGALDKLEAKNILHVRTREYFGLKKSECQALKSAVPCVFSDQEQKIIRYVVGVICENHTAASISDLSHDLIWDAARVGEDIPINAVLAARAVPVTDEDKKWANAILKERVTKGNRRSRKEQTVA